MRQRADAACSAAMCDVCTLVVSACKSSEPEYTIVLHWLQRILSKDGVAGRGGLAEDARAVRLARSLRDLHFRGILGHWCVARWIAVQFCFIDDCRIRIIRFFMNACRFFAEQNSNLAQIWLREKKNEWSGRRCLIANHLRNKTDAIGLLLLQSTAGHERAGDYCDTSDARRWCGINCRRVSAVRAPGAGDGQSLDCARPIRQELLRRVLQRPLHAG